MHTPEESQGHGDVIQQAESIAHAAADSADQPIQSFIISIFDVDLPAFLVDGQLYVQAPLQGVLDAFEATLSTRLTALEAGISEARRTALALSRDGRAISQFILDLDGVVRGSGE